LVRARVCSVCGPRDDRTRRRELDATRPSTTARGYGWAWQKVRARVLRERGSCEVCGAVEQLEVHHQVALADGGTHDDDNLVVLCKAHHSSVTARTQGFARRGPR